MSLPNIPNIAPIIKLNKREIIHLMLASIALEEISLSHILNAEGEKIQAVLTHHPTLHDIFNINRSVEKTLRNVIKQEMLLQFKMEDILEFRKEEHKEFEEEECEIEEE